jgi:hypothetical protein
MQDINKPTPEKQERSEQVMVILERFRGKPINQNVLNEFCNLYHLDAMTMNDYEDCLFQQEHDERVAKVIPAVFEILKSYKDVPTFAPKKERKAIIDANEDIEWQIAKVFEDCGVVKSELKIITGNFGSNLKMIIENAGERAVNMCDAVLREIGEDKFGVGLPIKPMAEFYRAKAKKLSEDLTKTQ